MIGGIEHETGGRLEPLRDFGGIGHDFDIGWHHRQHRGDLEARTGVINVALPDHAHIAWANPELFPGFSQGSFDRAFAGVDLAAREGYLSRMGAHVRWAVEQQEAWLVAIGDSGEHGGWTEIVDPFKVLAAEQFRRRAVVALSVKAADAAEQVAHSGNSEKRAP